MCISKPLISRELTDPAVLFLGGFRCPRLRAFSGPSFGVCLIAEVVVGRASGPSESLDLVKGILGLLAHASHTNENRACLRREEHCRVLAAGLIARSHRKRRPSVVLFSPANALLTHLVQSNPVRAENMIKVVKVEDDANAPRGS